MQNTSWLTFFILSLIFMIVTPSCGQRLNKGDRERLKQIETTLTSREPSSRRDIRHDQTIEKAEKFNTIIDKLMQFINTLAQLDNFINEKTKMLVHKLNAVYNADDDFLF